MAFLSKLGLIVLAAVVFSMFASGFHYTQNTHHHYRSSQLFGFQNFLNKAGGRSSTIEVEFLLPNKEKKVVKGVVGQPLSEIAALAEVDIKFKCRKGECSTCLVNINGQWVQACQTTVGSEKMSVKIRDGPITKLNVKEEEKKAAFFSPKSLADGFNNNVLGMVGLVKEGKTSLD